MKPRYLTTAEFAERLAVKPATASGRARVDGHYLGIRPIKLPNRRLLWPLAEVEKLTGETDEAAKK